jgi:hypothetical protein
LEIQKKNKLKTPSIDQLDLPTKNEKEPPPPLEPKKITENQKNKQLKKKNQ